MGTDELAANLFRASLTEQKLRNDPTITEKGRANDARHDVGKAVRTVILEQGSTAPEKLPTREHSIRELERREQKRIAATQQAERQPALFPEESGNENG
jgi:DNA-damage-inducible protein D